MASWSVSEICLLFVLHSARNFLLQVKKKKNHFLFYLTAVRGEDGDQTTLLFVIELFFVRFVVCVLCLNNVDQIW